ncbi:endonuclease/exonuclease/phosphatase family protein [Aureimonas sp. ME7]|uniref:endonuclease/exonuclease/phosphatase family protein n=1 Tax=Aureimonas sp. ME7 TaxID=2744252 RepID=UPI0015F5F771|nr:endonuclease/exonuclease/phosphatase family protein [Aureimonas sp. ME7]
MRHRDEWAGAASALAGGLVLVIAASLLFPKAVLMPAISQLMPYMALCLFAPAFVLLALRRRVRAVLVIAVAAFAVGLTWWRFESVAAPRVDPASGGVDFTLLSFNVLFENRNAPSAVPYLLSSGADALLLMEASPLRGSIPELMKTYPYKLGCAGQGECDTLLLSKHPPVSTFQATLDAVPHRRYVQFKLDIDGRALNLVGAHMSKPYFDEIPDYELASLTGRIKALKGPVILAGDFNSAPWSPGLMQLAADTGLRFSGFYVSTWPVTAGRFGLPIDHVLTRGAQVLSLEALPDTFGSNHRGLLARIRIP